MATPDVKTAIEKYSSNDNGLNNELEFHGIKFSVDRFETSTLDGGISGIIIYVKIGKKRMYPTIH